MSMPTTTADRLVDRIQGDRVVNPDLELALDELKNGLPDYRQAEEYYEDRAPEFFASVRLRRIMAATGKAFKMNFASIPVDAVAHRLEVATTTCPDSPDATEWIAEQWQRNELDLEMPTIMLRACEYGDGYIFVWPADRDDDEGSAAPAGGSTTMPDATTDHHDSSGHESVDIYYNSPLTTRIIYDTENPRRKRLGVRRWVVSGKRVRVDLIYRDRIEKYISKKNTPSTWDAKYFEPYWDDPADEWPYENPYNLIPIFHLRTDRPYGVPLHKGFYGVQDALRKLIVSHMATVDYQSFRQRYALTAGDSDTSEAAEADEDEFAFADAESGATKRTGGEGGTSQLRSDPGELWFMRGVNQVGSFDEADPEVFLKPMERYLMMGAQITGTPMRLFDYARAQLPSGVSQDAADGPFVEKCRRLIASFSATLQDVWEAALVMGRFSATPVTVDFTPPEHVTGLEGWRIVLAKIEAGMPPRQAFSEAGKTKAQIDAWFGETDDDIGSRLALIKEIALVMQALGAAATFEMLDAEQIKQLVGALLSEVVTTSQPAPEDASTG